MFIDARTIPSGTQLEADVCVVGAGAAGITLARELNGNSRRVALIESGGFEYANDVQALYQGENVGRDYFALEACRLRYFGGSTMHWAGTCRPLDALDFYKRAWVPHSGWPLSRSDLNPYYERAQPVLQMGSFRYELEDWTKEDRHPLWRSSEDLATTYFQQSPPTRFGTEYRSGLDTSPDVVTYTHATVVAIETDAEGAQVIGLKARTLGGAELRFTARAYVLAMGGIEIPRLLLISNEVMKTGLGNQNDLVGRFFQEHLILQAGVIALSDPTMKVDLFENHEVEMSTVKAFLTPTPTAATRLNLLNFGARPNVINSAFVSKGVASYVHVRNELRRQSLPDDLFEHVASIILEIDDVYRHAVRDELNTLSLKYWQESAPNPDSRVSLADTRDALGLRKVRLDWRLSELDRVSFGKSLQLIAQELGKQGVGRLQIADDEDALWTERAVGSCHHMGTTRMAEDPKQGVVDRNSKVHGVGNLFIAGSSVFPTSGHANPTLTIVALSIRLADHIKELLA